MRLKALYDNQDDIPEAFRELYSERDSKWELTGIDGVKTEADVARVQEGARKEREDHKKTKTRLQEWEALGSHEDVQDKLDKYPELEVAAQGNIDEKKLEGMVTARLDQHTAPLKRDLKKAQDDLIDKDKALTEYATQDVRRKIHDAVRKAATPADGPKVRDTAMDDILMVGERMLEVVDGKVIARADVGVTPGISPEGWLAEMQKGRPHWWPESEGGGAGGGGGGGYANSPFTKQGWNLTEQGKIVREKGLAKAEEMAKAAGVKLGATKPAG